MFKLRKHPARHRSAHATLAALALAAGAGCAAEESAPEDAPGLAAQELPAGGAPLWAGTGDMGTARNGHVAVTLQDGRVLVAGGQSSEMVGLDGAELYDPVAGAFTPIQDAMSRRRRNFTATRLQDGRVLVAGGYDQTSYVIVGEAELYDPDGAPNGGSFSDAGMIEPARYRHTATWFSDASGNERVLVVGGSYQDSSLESVWIYAPDTGQWSPRAAIPSARARHTATLLDDGRILITGGEIEDAVDDDRAFLYDPSSNQWTEAAPMAGGRERHTATLLPGGDVLVTGAFATAERYHPATDSWAPVGSIPYDETAKEHAAVRLPSGAVLVSGGTNDPTGAALFYPDTNTWKDVSPMLSARLDHAAAVLDDGRVLLTGGAAVVNGDATASAELWDGKLAGEPCAFGAECRSGYCDACNEDLAMRVCKDGPVPCSTDDSCQQGTCDQATDTCVYWSMPAGTPCDGGVCNAGICVSDAAPGPRPDPPLSPADPRDDIPPRPDDGGCGCRAAGAAPRGTLPALALLMLAAGRRGRRRLR